MRALSASVAALAAQGPALDKPTAAEQYLERRIERDRKEHNFARHAAEKARNAKRDAARYLQEARREQVRRKRAAFRKQVQQARLARLDVRLQAAQDARRASVTKLRRADDVRRAAHEAATMDRDFEQADRLAKAIAAAEARAQIHEKATKSQGIAAADRDNVEAIASEPKVGKVSTANDSREPGRLLDLTA